MDMLKILIPIVIAHVAVLVIIILVIKKLLLNDTANAVNRIRQVENEVRKKEEGIRKEIEEHEKEFTKKKSEAEEALQKQKETSEKEVARMRDTVLADAKKESDKIGEQAKKNEERMKVQLLQQMEEKAVDYGADVFKMVISEKINAEMNKEFINELIEALEQVDGDSMTVDAKQSEFKSSHPIAPEQKARMEQLFKEKFKVDVKVEEKVVPELLAGVVFKLGSMEIDGSLLNRFKEAAAEVKKSAKA